MITGALWVALLAAAGELPPPTPAGATPPATPATAAPSPAPASVAVIAPPAGDAVLVEASTRIRAELAASGIASTQIDCTPGGAADEAGCPAGSASATISLGREDGVAEIDARRVLPDGLELHRHVRVLARDGGEDPSVLAVRAVELLRDLRPIPRPPPAPLGPARDDEEPGPVVLSRDEDRSRPSTSPAGRWRLNAGVAGLASLERPNIGPAAGVAVSAGLLVGRRLVVFATGAGPFTADAGNVHGRSATLLQLLGTAELRYRLALGTVQPFGAVLAGVKYLKETASGILATQTYSAVVPAFGAGGGISLEYKNRFTATIEAEAFVTTPEQVVEIQDPQMAPPNGVTTGRVGAPDLLVLAGMGLVLP